MIHISRPTFTLEINHALETFSTINPFQLPNTSELSLYSQIVPLLLTVASNLTAILYM